MTRARSNRRLSWTDGGLVDDQNGESRPKKPPSSQYFDQKFANHRARAQTPDWAWAQSKPTSSHVQTSGRAVLRYCAEAARSSSVISSHTPSARSFASGSPLASAARIQA